MPMNRREFLAAAGAGAASCLWPRWLPGQDSNPRLPNIVLIVADDLGYAETGMQGGRDIPTPHIDSIAKNGVRFTNGYVSCPVCSPTRAGLLTGRYQQRFGHEFNPGPENAAEEDFGLPLTETTLAERLKPMGYATGMFGKWHLGYKPQFRPVKRGFDEFYGFLGGGHTYLPAGRAKGGNILRGDERVEEKEYLTDAIAREACSFVGRNKQKPFFLYVPFNGVHSPLEATEKYLSRFASIKQEKRRTFAAMLSAVDDGVGAVLAKLRESALEENTLVLFHSDNGGPTSQTSSRNDPLRGFKSQALEGGIRVPFAMQWKGRLPAGKAVDEPVITLDVHPTAVAAAGGKILPEWKLDGVDLVPFLRGDASGAPHDALFWRMGQKARAIRKGNWKLVWGEGGETQLYDVVSDPGESRDQASAQAGKVRELKEAFRAWEGELAEPKWGRRGGKRNP